MSSQLLQVVIYTLIPVVAGAVGGVIAAYKPPGERVTSLVQHFAAGAVLGAVAGKLVPKIVESKQALPWVVVGFAAGLALMIGVKLLSDRFEQGGGSAGLIITTGVDVFIDGIIIGIGLIAGGGAGFLLVIALSLEILFLGLSTASAFGGSGRGHKSRLGLIAKTASVTSPIVLGGLLSVFVLGTLLGGVSTSLTAALFAFGAVALLYLVMEELLVEAHEVQETIWDTSLLFAAFVLVIAIEMLR